MKSPKIKLKLKILRLIFFLFALLIFFSLILGISQAGKNGKSGKAENENKNFSISIPHDLEIVPGDYDDMVETPMGEESKNEPGQTKLQSSYTLAASDFYQKRNRAQQAGTRSNGTPSSTSTTAQSSSDTGLPLSTTLNDFEKDLILNNKSSALSNTSPFALSNKEQDAQKENWEQGATTQKAGAFLGSREGRTTSVGANGTVSAGIGGTIGTGAGGATSIGTDGSSSETVQVPSAFNTGTGYASPGINAANIAQSAPASYRGRLASLRSYLSGNTQTGAPSEPEHIQRGRNSGIFVSQSKSNGGLLSGGAASQAGNLLSNAIQFPEAKSEYDMLNSQKSKKDFLNQKQSQPGTFDSSSRHSTLNTESTVVAGSVIPIVLLTKINSDLPGRISARVVENIYDTFYGHNLLIPKGTLLLGSYDSQISWGQLRVLVVWERLTRPDGVTLVLQGMQGVDSQGAAGVISKVKTNIGKSIGITVLSSLFKLGVDYGSAYAYSSTGSQPLSDAVRSSADSTVSTLTELANKLIERQPTLTVEPGTVSLVFVHHDIELPPVE